MSNSGQPADAKGNLEEILQVALSHSLLSQADVNQVLQSVGGTRENVVPQAFARQAIQLGKLTLFQAKLLLSKDPSALSIGPYLILDKIGQGGMGSVYKARHKSMDRIVALKVLRRRDGFSQETIKRFQREVLAAAKLIHPNIVTAFDAGEQNGLHFLVMEYVSGGDLKSLLDQRGPLSVAQALNYTQQVARGMQYAHDKQIIHRDIKPANLLLDSDGCVKILDLGLARIIREETQDELQTRGLTADGALMGTVDYLSPEQSLDTKTADMRSDIYSLGCTLYTLLTGEAVYPAGTLVQKILAHREAAIPSLRLRRSDIPEALDQLFQQMIAKSPAARPQSMASVAEVLQRIAAGGDVSDVVPKAYAPLSTTSEDAFLETLIVGSGDTVKETDLPAASLVASPNKPLPSAVRPALAHRRKTKRSKLALWQVGAWLGAGVGVIGLIMWMLLFSQEAAETDLGMNEPRPQPKATTPSETPKTNNEQASVVNSPTPPSPNDPNANKLDGGMTPNDAPSNVSDAPEVPEVPPEPEPPKPLTGTLPGSGSADGRSSDLPPSSSEIESRVLVVGLGSGEIADLNSALQIARPNDEILIRHRGPLELASIDLTDKTPLTIRGDNLGDRDFWPIIRQATSSTNSTAGDLPAQAWIYGDNLNLKFKNLHLGVGGYTRAQLDSVFACTQGSIELENCTFTAAPDETSQLPTGPTYPFLRSNGADKHNVSIRFLNTIIRGGRIENLARLDGAASIFVNFDNVLWAGGEGDLVHLGHETSSAAFECNRSILYNPRSLCGIQPTRIAGPQLKDAFDLELKNTIINFFAADEGHLARFVGRDDKRLNYDEWAKYVKIRVDGLLLSQTDSLMPVRDKKSTLKSFLDAFGISSGKLSITNPHFRVYPSSRELHEIDARDFLTELSDSESRKNLRGMDTKNLGLDQNSLPPVLACVMEEGRNTASLATTPRGRPRILVVDSAKGPYKTLEAALRDLSDDDIIEIADDKTYIPSRNFDLSSGSGVMNLENVPHLNIRAAIGKSPTVLLSDSMQYQAGKFLQQSAADNSLPPLLMLYASCRAIKIDGITFRSDINRPNSKHYFIHTSASCMRITNCSFLNFANSKPPIMEDTFGGMVVVRPLSWEASNDRSDLHGGMLWIENSVFNNGPPREQNQVSNQGEPSSAFGYAGRADLLSESFIFRNCFFGPHATALNSVSSTPNQWICFEGCTIMGKPFSLNRPRKVRSIEFTNNFVLALTNPIPCNPASLLDELTENGHGNAVLMDDNLVVPQFRNLGALRLMPGDALKNKPVYKYLPPASSSEVENIFYLKPNSELRLEGDDKELVGFRPSRARL